MKLRWEQIFRQMPALQLPAAPSSATNSTKASLTQKRIYFNRPPRFSLLKNERFLFKSQYESQPLAAAQTRAHHKMTNAMDNAFRLSLTYPNPSLCQTNNAIDERRGSDEHPLTKSECPLVAKHKMSRLSQGVLVTWYFDKS